MTVTPELLASHIRDFMACYVKEELKAGASKQLATICKLYAILALQDCTKNLTEGILTDLLTA